MYQAVIHTSTFAAGNLNRLLTHHFRRPVDMNASVLVALQLFQQWSVHRIPVVEGDGKLNSILSQSTVVPWIYKNLRLYAHLIHNVPQQ